MIGPAYLAVIDPQQSGRGSSSIADAQAQFGLALAYEGPALVILSTPGSPVRAIGRIGAVIGTLFDQAGSPVERALGPNLEATEARALIDHFWGDYLALAAHPGSKTVTVLRAPAGRLPAYRTRQGCVTYYASHIDLLSGLELISPAIDWGFVAHRLAFPHLPNETTGLHCVEELLPGNFVREYGRAGDAESLWSPWTFASPDRQIRSFAKATANVHDAVVSATSALTCGRGGLLLELSGGLDSSIIAASLAENGRSAVAYNLSTSGKEGDERIYARQVSEHCGFPLIEEMAEGSIDLTAPVRHVTARPAMPAMLSIVDARFEAKARELHVDAFIGGMGGDCVFCSLGSAAPATDACLALGPGTRLFATLGNVARVHNSNVWTVVRLMMRQLVRRRSHRGWRRDDTFLHRPSLPTRFREHSWLIEPDNALPGSRAHIQQILGASAHLDDYGRNHAAPSLFPLLTQPVIEACLATPSWLWVEGGQNRAAARAAFRGRLPDAILDRRTKGGMEAFCARTFEANRDRLRPFLLDGLLAQAGLLDRASIDAYLTRPFTNRDSQFYSILPIADMEAWARGVIGSA
ncbi:MAG: hypothetical protein BGN95_08265 [Sphingomonas sp. 66-10]|uniref:asparagine synthase-related protein n=1 Tax=Sphingomonas sp. 66-10 TaxID=1895848 RepID=UPI0009265372|nr:asparagine synthase-related protein [Sphingomonas sp. 66-10]OJU23297.1 MAG: hypothetical protein BGN95_08265 [Sphingomonas sp. 66-10]